MCYSDEVCDENGGGIIHDDTLRIHRRHRASHGASLAVRGARLINTTHNGSSTTLVQYPIIPRQNTGTSWNSIEAIKGPMGMTHSSTRPFLGTQSPDPRMTVQLHKNNLALRRTVRHGVSKPFAVSKCESRMHNRQDQCRAQLRRRQMPGVGDERKAPLTRCG